MKNNLISIKYILLYAFIAGFLMSLSFAFIPNQGDRVGLHLLDTSLIFALSVLLFFCSLWLNIRLIAKTIYVRISANIILYILLCVLAIIIHKPIWLKLERLPVVFYIRDEFIRNLMIFSISYIVAQALNTFRQNQFMKNKIIEIQRENQLAQIETLKQQINPHFLFNSLNTLSGLAQEDPQKTVLFIDKLSQIYRYVLDIQEKNLVPLFEEFEFAKAYIYLLEVRFSEKLSIDFKINGNKNDMLPSLCSQILIENVIKHNCMTKQNPIKINFFVEDGYFVVKNTVNLQKNSSGPGIGLKNLDTRSHLLIGKPIEIISTANYFTVKIPLQKQ